MSMGCAPEALAALTQRAHNVSLVQYLAGILPRVEYACPWLNNVCGLENGRDTRIDATCGAYEI